MICGIVRTLLFILGFIWTAIIIARLPGNISELKERYKAYKTRFDPEVYKWEIGTDNVDNQILVEQYRERVERQFKEMFITYVCIFWPLTALYIVWFLITVLLFVIGVIIVAS
mgnify:CR=1 FL=1